MRCITLWILCVLAAIQYNAVAAHPGSYALDVPYVRGSSGDFFVQANFPKPTIIGGPATINSVRWRYDYRDNWVGLQAYICWRNDNNCLDISNQASGFSEAFRGRDASEPFKMLFRHRSGRTGDIYSCQIIVNYQ
ncbi:hypothetical protein TSAR_015867 [Trichomalopsis sarcophagae]|uniref:Uncharacterized protein n=1 Tax=Trichomalopsis sarcophagae TaxID=543379 RepID=A0A232F1D1_9HYME|nr:hypothetical protein TSAR_015867 [Trichomalopsis sarcophagae]